MDKYNPTPPKEEFLSNSVFAVCCLGVRYTTLDFIFNSGATIQFSLFPHVWP